MSYKIRGARVAFDNIAVGSTAGRENPAVGSAGSTEKYSGGSNIITANGETSKPASSTEPTSDYARDRIITSSGGVTTQYVNETIINTNS